MNQRYNMPTSQSLLLALLILGAGCTGTYERSGGGAQGWPLTEEMEEEPDAGQKACIFQVVYVFITGKGEDSCECFDRPTSTGNHDFDCALLREDLQRGHKYELVLDCSPVYRLEEVQDEGKRRYEEYKRLVQMSVRSEIVDEFVCRFDESP